MLPYCPSQFTRAGIAVTRCYLCECDDDDDDDYNTGCRQLKLMWFITITKRHLKPFLFCTKLEGVIEITD